MAEAESRFLNATIFHPDSEPRPCVVIARCDRLALRLFGEPSKEAGSLSYWTCPHHRNGGSHSLEVNRLNNTWKCVPCGVNGGLRELAAHLQARPAPSAQPQPAVPVSEPAGAPALPSTQPEPVTFTLAPAEPVPAPVAATPPAGVTAPVPEATLPTAPAVDPAPPLAEGPKVITMPTAPEPQAQDAHAAPEPDQPKAAKPDAAASVLPEFPAHALVGSLGDLARCLAGGSEVPEEFVFGTALVMMGAKCSKLLKLQIGIEVEPRLYVALIGESYSAKKSSALRANAQFFAGLTMPDEFFTLWGVGSAEGLARTLNEHPQTVLAYDELSSFVSKSGIEGATLAQITAALFEQTAWDNPTKYQHHSVSVRNASLSLVGCSTLATWEKMWTPTLLSIGLPNRFLLIGADAKPRIAWPDSPDEAELAAIRERIDKQRSRLPVTLGITPEAKEAWTAWYNSFPSTEHSKRLDTIGLRLLPLIALTTDKDVVDLATVETVCSILGYELGLRTLLDPLDVDNAFARLEEKIRRTLAVKGPMRLRDLRRAVHGERSGTWIFQRSLENVCRAGDVHGSGDLYQLRRP